MTKTEAIQKAYGDDWKSVSQIIDENGWICRSGIRFRTFLNKNTKIQLSKHRFRPESLRGIENNNGWISIERFDYNDQNGKRNRYFLLIDGEIVIGYWHPDNKLFFQLEGHITISKPTHYQPISKPKPPIY